MRWETGRATIDDMIDSGQLDRVSAIAEPGPDLARPSTHPPTDCSRER